MLSQMLRLRDVLYESVERTFPDSLSNFSFFIREKISPCIRPEISTIFAFLYFFFTRISFRFQINASRKRVFLIKLTEIINIYRTKSLFIRCKCTEL